MAKKFVEFGKLLGETFKVDEEECANDLAFMLDTMDVAGTAEGASLAIKAGEQLELAIEFFEDFKKDLQNGVEQGWFEPASVTNIIKVADDNIALAVAKLG